MNFFELWVRSLERDAAREGAKNPPSRNFERMSKKAKQGRKDLLAMKYQIRHYMNMKNYVIIKLVSRCVLMSTDHFLLHVLYKIMLRIAFDVGDAIFWS